MNSNIYDTGPHITVEITDSVIYYYGYLEQSHMVKKTEAKRTYKLDIMTVLEAADKGVKDFYLNLTEEEQKAFAPRVVLRWLSAVSDKSGQSAYAILATNDLINLGFWNLTRHPELLWLLMCVSSTGRKQYHAWIPQHTKTTSTPKLDEFITHIYPHINSQETQILKRVKSVSDWISLMQDAGCDDKQIKAIKDELKKANPHTGD